MLYRCVGVLIYILISNPSFSQEHDNTSITTYIDSIIKSKPHSNDTLIKIEQKLLEYDTLIFAKELGYAYHELGKLYYSNQQYTKAIRVTKKAVKAKQKIKDTFEIHKSLNNLYFFYTELNRNTDAERLAVLNQILENREYDKYTLQAYIKAAKIYIDKGDYHKALKYLDHLIKTYPIHHTDTKLLVIAYIESIKVYSELKINSNQLHLIEFYNRNIEKYAAFSSENDLAANDNNLGNIYEDLELDEKAISHYKKALRYYLKVENNGEISKLYNNLGNIYSRLKNTKKATEYFNKALKITDAPDILADVSHNKGFYLETNNPIEKIPYYQKSLQYLLGNDYQYTSLDTLPSITAIQTSEYAIEILEDLIQIANAWVLAYNLDQKISNLHNAKETIHLIDQLISYIRFESSINQSKLFWINRGVDTYMLGVKVSYLLNDVKSAFYFMEKNKALVLLENLNTIRTQEPTISTLDSVQKKHVSKTSNFIEYIVNEKEGYGIFCNDASTEFFRLNNVNELLQQVEILKNQCSTPFAKKEDGVEYAKNAYAIFQKLFPFKDALQKISNKKLTIVSDYKIKNIPFEALTTTDKAATIREDYLIHKAEISYLHSASVLAQVQQKEYNPKNTFLGIAPETFATDSLVALKNSIQDIHKIASLFSATLLEKEKASKETVLSAIHNYKIIHFNTHAGINERIGEPWLALYDQKINLQEIYHQPTQADLVVLDACKSAAGKLEIGEGVMSLSRGFTYSGAKSVIASQWNANEKAVSTLFQTFYKELQKGTSKSKALHQAKLSYLSTHELSEISPYYWASMTLTGDTESVATEQNSYIWWVFLSVGILLLFYFLYVKK